MVVLTVRSVLKDKPLEDEALMEIKIKLAKQLFKKSYSKEKIQMIMFFLNSYINFENDENNIIFGKNLDQIEGRKETMGIVEMVLEEREKRGMRLGQKRGIELGMKRGERRGIRLGEERGIKLGEKRGIKLGEERGEKRGEKRKNREFVTNLIQKDFTDDLIMDVAGVSADYIQKIRASLK